MEFRIGSTATMVRAFDQRDFDRFAALSGDDNPIHVDAGFAARTRFGRTVAHGMLLYSAICRVLAHELDAGFEQRAQDLMFLAPTYAGEAVTISLEVVAVDAALGTADVTTNIVKADGSFACQGRAIVALPGSERPYTPSNRAASGEESATQHRGLRLGQTSQITRTFTSADLAEYRDLSGDPHPSETAPGGLLGGLFSFLLGTRLPGRGTNWLKQRLAYPAPCFVGEEIAAVVEIVRLRPEKDLVNLRGTCVAGRRVVCEGESLVLVKDLESA